MILRHATTITVSVGPVLSKADGVTVESGLAAALDSPTTGIMLSKAGGAMAIRHQPVTPSVYDTQGCYQCTFDMVDTNTLGTLRLIYTDPTLILPVWRDVLIVNQVEWDATCGNALRPVNIMQVLGLTADLPNAVGIVDTLLGRNLAGGLDGGRTVSSALRALRNRVTMSGNVLIVYAEDDATIAWQASLVTNPSAKPITEIDPA